VRNCRRLGALMLLALTPSLAQADVVSISVDATQRGEPLKHVWRYCGFDECNCTTTLDGVDLMKTAARINLQPVHRREHFLLNSDDDAHGNGYAKWLELGSPQTPDSEMLAQLRTVMQLEMLEPVAAVDIADGHVSLSFELPRFGLSLVLLDRME